MILLALALLIPIDAMIAVWAHRTGGPGRLWATSAGAIAVLSMAAVGLARAMVRGAPPGPASVYLAVFLGVPLLSASAAAATTRGQFVAAMLGALIGFVVVVIGAELLLWGR